MNELAIHNPATGALSEQVGADDTNSVVDKAAAARLAQPRWAALPMVVRKDCIVRFRAAVVLQLESLAATMTAETGKPIRM